MKKEISLIIKKNISFCLFLFVFFNIDTTEYVRRLPVKYYPEKYLMIQPQDDNPIKVPQNIFELSKTIKNMLTDLGYGQEKPLPDIPLTLPIPFSHDTLEIIFDKILYIYKTNPREKALSLIQDRIKDFHLSQLIDIANGLNHLDTPADILPIFTKKIFDIVTRLSPQEIITHTKTMATLHSDLKKSFIEYVIPCLKNRIIQLYENDTNRRRTLLEESFICIAFSPDGTRFITSNLDNLIVRDTQTSQEIKRIKGHFTNVVFSPDGTRIIATSDRFNGINDDGLLIIYNAETLEIITKTLIPQNTITALAISPDGTKIVTGISSNLDLILWDALTLQEITHLKGHTYPEYKHIITIAFSPDGKQIISGSSSSKSTDNLILWNAQTYQKITNFDGYSRAVESVKFSPDSRRIIVGGYDKNPAYEEGKNISYFLADLTVWDSKTHQEITSLLDVKGRNISTVSFSPDGTYIASGNLSQILALWDAQTFTKIIDLDVQVPITNLVFSPDGKEIFYSNYGKRGEKGAFAWNLEEIQALDDFKISDSAASINATILIHRLCSAIEKGITINLSPEELDVFNTLPDFVKKLLTNNTSKPSRQKPVSPTFIQPPYLEKRVTTTEEPVTTAPSFMQKFDMYAEKFMRWLRGKQNK